MSMRFLKGDKKIPDTGVFFYFLPNNVLLIANRSDIFKVTSDNFGYGKYVKGRGSIAQKG